MNGELENLKNQLKEVEEKLQAYKAEKAKLDELKKNGNFSDNLQEYYNSIAKAILASENIIAKISEKINELEGRKDNNSYRLSKGMIPYSTLKCYDAIDEYRQVDTRKQANPNDDRVVIDIEPDDYNEIEEDYLSKDRKKRIAESAIIAALLIGIGAAAFKLYDAVEERQKNKENTSTYEPVADDTNSAYDYENNTVVIPEDPYASVQNYVEIYRAEYEEMRELYNLTYADAVDYVNRAHSIQSFNFFPEASIDDVVRLLMNIDNKKLFTQNDDGLTSMLVTVIGQVAENAVWGQPTQEDIHKMEALQYFAKDGSDLDEFLTELGEINKRVLTDPNNSEAKHDAYLYLRTFIHSFNSYDNMINYINEYPETDYGQELASDLANGEILTDEVLKEKAMVKDSYDWYFSYNLTSAFASIYAPIDYNEAEFAKWDELWMMGETALESPEIQEICNNGLGLTLGGE